EYLYPEAQAASVFPDDSYFVKYRDLDKTCESIATLSEHDADAYRRFFDYSRGIMDFLAASLYSPAPAFGQMVAMLDSTPEGQEILRALLMSSWDIINEWFEDERVKVAMLKLANEPMMYPEAKGTGVYLFLMVPMIQMYGFSTPKGGGVQLPLSLVRCLEDNGGKVYLNSEVAKIKVEGNRAVGVTLTSGEEVRGKKAVVCGLHPKILFNRLLDSVPAELLRKINRLTPSSHSTISANYALNEAPNYKVGGDVNRSIVVELLPFMEGFRQHYDDCRYGIAPRQPIPYVACHDVIDPTKSPTGKANIQLYDPAPYHLRDGGAQKWDQIKEEVEDRKLEWVRQFTTNMGPDNILARRINSPLDLERWNPNYVEGDVMALGSDLYQYMANRPIPELGHYRTPIEGLYLCGPATHPGGGISGGGRAAVQVVMEDLGIDFDKVIG
ncbi:MAG TPA: NAD(P)/FAD-dependent oxidoreductase, partial [Bellilinea sp.]|nr:NAD(P)/FAD-dependent oxidoreductase [Bellilinea sp.]